MVESNLFAQRNFKTEETRKAQLIGKIAKFCSSDLFFNPRQLSRIEIIGDNCEMGFVLDSLGYQHSSLFKWTITPADALLKALKDDLRNLYQYNNLEPKRPDMVVDNAYGIVFHTTMKSSEAPDGSLTFIHNVNDRRTIYEQEIEKIEYLKNRFFTRASTNGTIYLIKSNAGIALDLLDDIERELIRITNGHRFSLLEVRKAEIADQVGTVNRISPHHFTGFIKKFADYPTASTIEDVDGWTKVIKKIISL